ncbi:hypothetical protein O3W44_21350 [Pantoea sp. LMR881]|uniref:glycosyltransferase family 9 protein n=1 Tax=Pantoea sp. LMR881 TaxID=3014336 RepID=UPI0022AE960F|nr:glycosyltransferase family 9 protein [Pantoea sp. LMR881]MCZ4061092.1 hypothetical protein [Pantoea sp. LMR881]
MKRWKLLLAEKLLEFTADYRSRVDCSEEQFYEPERIAVFCVGSVGDFVISTPALRAVRKRFPSAKILMITTREIVQLVKSYGWFSHVLVRHTNVAGILRFYMIMKKFRPQITITLGPHAPVDVVCAALAGSKEIYMDSGSDESVTLKRFASRHTGSFSGHIIQRQLALTATLGAITGDVRMFLPKAFIRDKTGKTFSVAFHLTEMRTKEQWPLKRFHELAKALMLNFPGIRIVLIGNRADEITAIKLANSLYSDMTGYFCIATGITDVASLVSLIRSQTVLITGDSCLLQVAIAARIRTVILQNGYEKVERMPIQDLGFHRTITVRRNSLDDFEITRVFSAFRHAIEESRLDK